VLTRLLFSKRGGPNAIDPHAALPLIRRLLTDFGKVYWPRYAVALTLMAIAAGSTALLAYIVGEVINRAYIERNFQAIQWLAAVTAGIFLVKGAATYGQSIILARIANSIVAENQRRLFRKVLTESLGFVVKRHSSEFVARLQAGAAAAGHTLNVLVTAFGRDLLTLTGLVAVMIYQDPVLSLITLFVAPPAILVLRKLVRRVKSVAYRQFLNAARILQTLQEMLQGIRIVKAFTFEPEMLRRAYSDIAEIESAANKMARVANRSTPLMETLGGFAIALVMLYAGYKMIESGSQPGAFASFLTAFLLAYEPAKRLARLNIDISGAMVGVRALFDVLDGIPGEAEEQDLPALRVGAAQIEMRNVTFGYRPDEPVLRGLSFVAEPGRVTALVGPSGGGKSTTLNLLMRFYEPNDGAILIDGQNIADVKRASLRGQIAYVGQESFLFNGSIRENILVGRANASDDELIAAAKAAFAHDFIKGFPQGYDSPVGEHGLQLSGGQRQRLAIARALIKDAPIILLDEATAALDSESERAVQQAIARLCEGRTTLVIAHRLSTIMHADRILVIEEGRVAESGQHEDLLRREGRYSRFYRLQMLQQREQAQAPQQDGAQERETSVAPAG
jgi:ATP-binding cassette, subfamily B, bacterial MsbA